MLRKEQHTEELKWRANWNRLAGTFLELYPIASSDEKIEFFPGYYHLNCMLLQTARKQEGARYARDHP